MSRTKRNSGSSSPVKKYLSFKGGKGIIQYYDKGEEKNVSLDSLEFALVDVKSSVSGFNEGEGSGISSNLLEPFSVGEEEFVVKTKVNGTYGEAIRGVWKDIKAEVARFGGKFTTNLFIAADLGDGVELCRLELNGASLSPWIELQGEYANDELYDKSITITKGQLMKRVKGKNTAVSAKEYKAIVAKLKEDPMADKPVLFYEPKFEVKDITEEQIEVATELDEKLQEYLGSAPEETETAKSESTNESPKPSADYDDDDEDDLPF